MNSAKENVESMSGQRKHYSGSTCLRWWLVWLACVWITCSVAASDWRLTYGQAEADYLAAVQTFTNQGFRPISLDVDGTGAGARFSAIWLKDGLADWWMEYGLTPSQFSNHIASATSQGYRVQCVDSYGLYPQELYAVVWVKDALASGATANLRDLSWNSVYTWETNGLCPTWFDINPASSRWVATALCKRPFGWAAYYGMSEAGFRQRTQELSAWAWPVVVRSYSGVFAAIWTSRGWLDASNIRVDLNQTATEFSSCIAQYAKDGYEPISVAASGAPATALYNSVWKTLGKLLPNRVAGLEILPQGQAQLRFENEVPVDLGRFFELLPLQASSSLSDWQPLKTIFRTNSEPRWTVWSDAQAAERPQRFYRMPTNRFVTPLLLPSGPFGIGEFSALLTDPVRTNASRGTNLQFMVTCWYPASPRGGLLPAPYVAEGVAWSGFYTLPSSRVAGLAAHASLQASLATNSLRYPVVLYSPSLNSHRRENLMMVEELASHGFVVVGMDHRETSAAVYPDGQLVLGQSVNGSDPANVSARQPERTADARLVLDTLEQWQRDHPSLGGHLDLGHVGAFGFSFGGSTSADLANADPRCEAAVDIDGNLMNADLASNGPAKPFLLIRSDSPDSVDINDNRLTFFQRAESSAYFLKVAGTLHPSFFEASLLFDLDEFNSLYGSTNLMATADGLQVHTLARSALVSFFKRHLKAEEDGVLDQLATNSPAVCLGMTSPGAPVITRPLGNTNILCGQPLTLQVVATGTAPLKYEWLANGVGIPEATNNTLLIDPVTLASGGCYCVRVTNPGGTTTCSGFVDASPLRFTSQPLDVKSVLGGTAYFRVATLTPPAVSYQWLHDGVAIPDATNAVLQISDLKLTDMGSYRAMASNLFGTLCSKAVQLYLRPSLVDLPQTKILRVGDELNLGASVVGSMPMSYLWRREGVVLSRLTRNELTTTYSLPTVKTSDAGVYLLTVTNLAGYAVQGNTSASVLVVQPPLDQEAVPGATVTFTAGVANGSALPPGLQWQFNGVSIEGASFNTLTLTNIQPANAGTYTLLVTNNFNLSASFSATLKLTGP